MRRSALRRAASALAAMLAASLVLVGCVLAPQAAPGDVVRVGMREPTLPIAAENAGDPLVARLLPALTAGLVLVNEDGTIELDLAEAVTTTNNRDFEVTLRPDATFADGTPVTSESFVEAWRARALYNSGSPHRSAFSFVKGYVTDADADKDSDEPQGDIVAGGGLEVVDDTHFVIHLRGARPEFPTELGRVAYLPEAPADSAEDNEFAGIAALGAGPYRIVGSVPGDRLELEPNPGYGGPRVPVNSGISLRWFESEDIAFTELIAGEIDVVDHIPTGEREEWTELVDDRVVTQPLPEMFSLVLPRDEDRLRGEEGQLRVRALALAIDRTRLADEVHGGDAIPLMGFLPTTVPTISVEVPWAERANDINARRTWERANDFFAWEPSLTIAVVDGTIEEDIAQAIATRFTTALGIEAVVLRFTSQQELEEAVAEDDLTVFRIRRTVANTPAAPDMIRRLLSGLMPGPVRERLDLAAAAPDPVEAARLAGTAQDLLTGEPPLLPLTQPTVSAVYAEGVQGVRFTWTGALDLTAIAAPGDTPRAPLPTPSESSSVDDDASPSATSGS